MNKSKFAHLLPVLAILVVVLDQIIKWVAVNLQPLGEQITLIPGLFWFAHVRNTGISFGMLQGNNLLMIWIILIIFGVLIYHYEKFQTLAERVAYWFITGGLFGNLLDRIVRGSVVDMFAFGWWPVFNIADSAICIAVVILVVEEVIFFLKKSRKKSKKK
ncbi:signal peptidase II [Candidatus Woesearchaeota archaeon]|nr:signal peptidase II [Candidatus Woesearchaeota archaeon]